MAYDKQEPRTNLIVGFTAISVVVLVALDFVFRSYFHWMLEADLAAKQARGGAPQLVELRAREQRDLQAGSVPIERAVDAYAERGRAANPALAPQASADNGALTGWTKAPKSLALRPPPPPPPPPVDPTLDPTAVPVEGTTALPAPTVP